MLSICTVLILIILGFFFIKKDTQKELTKFVKDNAMLIGIGLLLFLFYGRNMVEGIDSEIKIDDTLAAESMEINVEIQDLIRQIRRNRYDGSFTSSPIIVDDLKPESIQPLIRTLNNEIRAQSARGFLKDDDYIEKATSILPLLNSLRMKYVTRDKKDNIISEENKVKKGTSSEDMDKKVIPQSSGSKLKYAPFKDLDLNNDGSISEKEYNNFYGTMNIQNNESMNKMNKMNKMNNETAELMNKMNKMNKMNNETVNESMNNETAELINTNFETNEPMNNETENESMDNETENESMYNETRGGVTDSTQKYSDNVEADRRRAARRQPEQQRQGGAQRRQRQQEEESFSLFGTSYSMPDFAAGDVFGRIRP